MNSKFLSLALLLAIVAVACAKSSHSKDSIEKVDSNNLNVKSSFMMSMPLFLRNAIDALTSTHAPPTTQRQCDVTDCENGGSLRAGNSGSCPTCECPSGCNGTRCETCAPATTTAAPTTKYNCNTLSCTNGGTPIYQGSSCWCSCPSGYQGDFCEYQNYCYAYYSTSCSNGGTPYYSPSSGTCTCMCPPCYYGSTCSSFNSNCDPSSTNSTASPSCSMLGCMNGGVVIQTGTGCKCACAQSNGYSGISCELYNYCRNYVYCGNAGTAYYDPAMRTCQCACPTGYYGTNCAYSI